jgi:hypothetical protein
MGVINITFDNPDDYVFDEGIEVVDSMIRLIDPLQDTPLAAYWPLFISEDQYINDVIVDYATEDSVDSIPMLLFDREPTLDQVRTEVPNSAYNLEDLWSLLMEYGPGNWYMGISLGGIVVQEGAGFPPKPAPIGYWSFDDSNAVESQGLNLNGTVYGCTPATGRYNVCFYYDGGDYINFGNYPDYKISIDMSICMWLYPYSFNVRRNPVYKTYGGELAITQETDGTLNYFYGTAGSDAPPYQGVNSVKPLELNKWTHIALIRDLTNRKIHWYMDGTLTASADAAYNSCAVTDYNLYLGHGYAGKYHGLIDDFMIYNRPLEDFEVQAILEQQRYEIITPTGQMSISNISISTRTTGFYAGNVVTEKVYAYKGNSMSDTLVHLSDMDEAANDYSNILLTQDRNKLDYCILYEGSGEADIVVNIPNTQENIIVRINDSYDAEWDCSGLYGSALDFMSSNRMIGRGTLKKLDDSWEMSANSSFSTTLPYDIDKSSLYLIVVIRKTSLSYDDVPKFSIMIGDTELKLAIDDNDEYIDIFGTKVKKDNMPWLTNYIKFTIIANTSYTAVSINDDVVYTLRKPIERNTASIHIIEADPPAQLKSFYFGPLAIGSVIYEDMDNMEKEVIVTGKIHCAGNMFMAGVDELDSIAQLYVVADNIYMDHAVYTKTPGFFFEDPILLGIRDAVTAKEMLFYGSKSEYGIYIFENGYWRLFEPDLRLFSVWRSRHTEGLIVQRKDESSIKIYLFGRDEETHALYYKKDIALTGLPEGEDPFKFEPSMDRRLSQKTTPWTWAKDKSLTN